MHRLGSLISVAIVLALVASFFGACTTHGEGGRCDSRNGNADCDSNLVCIPAGDIVLPLTEAGIIQHSNADICCPMDRSGLSAGDICSLNNTTPNSDASIPDTGTTDTGSDVTVDQSVSDVTSSDATNDVEDATTDSSGD
jgi:hypothetical protein